MALNSLTKYRLENVEGLPPAIAEVIEQTHGAVLSEVEKAVKDYNTLKETYCVMTGMKRSAFDRHMGSLNFDALYEVYDKICIQNKAESHKDASLEQFGQMFNLTFLGEFPGWFEKMSAVKVSTPLTVQAGVRGKIMEVFANGGKAA